MSTSSEDGGSRDDHAEVSTVPTNWWESDEITSGKDTTKGTLRSPGARPTSQGETGQSTAAGSAKMPAATRSTAAAATHVAGERSARNERSTTTTESRGNTEKHSDRGQQVKSTPAKALSRSLKLTDEGGELRLTSSLELELELGSGAESAHRRSRAATGGSTQDVSDSDGDDDDDDGDDDDEDQDSTLDRTRHCEHTSQSSDRFTSEANLRKVRSLLNEVPAVYRDEAKFNPLPHVVSILTTDDASDMRKLEHYCDLMDRAVDCLVEEKYRAFDSSVDTYRTIIGAVTQAQEAVDELGENVTQCQNAYQNCSLSVATLWLKTEQLACMIAILDKIEYLKGVEGVLADLIHAGLFLHAAVEVVRAAHAVCEPEILSIPALSRLRESLLNRKSFFHEILLDELQDILYLPGTSPVDLITMHSPATVHRGSAADSHSLSYTATESLLTATGPIGYDHFQNIIEALDLVGHSATAISTSLLNQLPDQLRYITSVIVEEIVNRQSQSTNGRKPIGSLQRTSSTSANNLPCFNKVVSAADAHPLFELLRQLFDRVHQILANYRIVTRLLARKYEQSQLDSHALTTELRVDERHQKLERIITVPLTTPQAAHPPASHESFVPIRAPSPAPTSRQFRPRASQLSSSARWRAQEAHRFCMERVWELIQEHLEDLLSLYLAVNTYSPVSSTNNSTSSHLQDPSGGKQDTLKRSEPEIDVLPEANSLFKFSRSSAATFDVPEQHGRHAPTVFRSSPYNIVPLMGLLSDFVRTVGEGLHSSISSSSLRQFLDSFTQKEFLQRILMTDCQQHMSLIFEQTNSFKPREYIKSTYKSDSRVRPLLHAMLATQDLVNRVLFIGTQLPTHADEILHVIESCLMRLALHTQNHVNQILADAASERMYSDRALATILRSDPRWQLLFDSMPSSPQRTSPDRHEYVSPQLTRNNPTSPKPSEESTQCTQEDSYRQEFDFYLGHTRRGIPLDALLLDPATHCLLAQIHDSISWLIENVHQLLDVLRDSTVDASELSPSPLSSSTGSGSREVWSARRLRRNLSSTLSSHTASASSSGSARHQESGFQNDPDRLMGEQLFVPQKLRGAALRGESRTWARSLENVIEKMTDCSEKCLFVLRVETRLHCIFFLNQLEVNYKLSYPSSEPDPCIVKLNADLSVLEDSLSSYLPIDKTRYILNDLPRFLSDLLICSLAHVKAVNQAGVARLCRNVLAAQQIASNISVSLDSEKLFERARQYFELLKLTPEELQEYFSNQKAEASAAPYSYEEYCVILSLVPNDPVSLAQLRTLLTR